MENLDRIIAGRELRVPQARAVREQRIGKKGRYIKDKPATPRVINIEDQKISRRKARRLGDILATILILMAASCATYNLRPIINADKRFKQAYETSVETYGNYDRENGISDAERLRFYKKFARDNGLIYRNGKENLPLYPNGEEVPIRELTRIFEEYVPERE